LTGQAQNAVDSKDFMRFACLPTGHPSGMLNGGTQPKKSGRHSKASIDQL
jgi:hypothetical protein